MEVPPHLLQDLFQAYFDARRNKRNTNNQLQFELNYEKNIFALFSQLKDKSYSISKSICFIVFYPVKREIFAGDFRDRVIHHLVFNALNPLFEKLFIYDSYSCRKEKGPLFGIKRVQYFHRSCSRNYQKESFFLKLDIQGYFMSIDQKILFQKIQRAIQRKQIPYAEFWLWLLELIIFHDPTKNCVIKELREIFQSDKDMALYRAKLLMNTIELTEEDLREGKFPKDFLEGLIKRFQCEVMWILKPYLDE